MEKQGHCSVVIFLIATTEYLTEQLKEELLLVTV